MAGIWNWDLIGTDFARSAIEAGTWNWGLIGTLSGPISHAVPFRPGLGIGTLSGRYRGVIGTLSGLYQD